MSLYEDIILEIQKSKWGYSFMPIPCEVDEKLRQLVQLFMDCSVSERLAIQDQANSIAGYLNSFAIRSAALAVRERSSQRLMEGLIALVIENCRAGDYRDTLTAIAPLYDAAGKIGEDADAQLKIAATYVDSHSSNLLLGFIGRPAYSKNLRQFGFKEVEALDGFRYEWSI